MPGPDETPPEGLAAEEPVTKPELLGPCPTCRGERYVYTCIEKADDGTLLHAAAAPCETCGGAGELTAAQVARINARAHGR